MISTEELRALSIFEDLDEDELAWLAEHFEEVTLDQGDQFTRAGDKAEWMFALLKGRVQFRLDEQQLGRGVFTVHEGQVSGMLPNSRMTHFGASSFAVEPSRVARLHIRHFPEMLDRIPVLEQRLAHVMLDRTRITASMRIQQEKLAALGTMAAGLAHELNNPASAARRAAQNLQETLQQFDELASTMLSEVMFKTLDGDTDPFLPVYEIVLGEPPELDPITQGEREDDLADWLDEQGVQQPWDAAATLVAAGLTQPFLAAFSEKIIPQHVINFLNWLARDIEMRMLSQELAVSTIRISDLVTAMKAYSYMDQANEKSQTDLHKGIKDTLTVMAHKLKKKDIRLVKQFGPVPPFEAYGGELNQVWTNLLDNAVDAVPDEGGVITIATGYDEGAKCIGVDIVDNGEGISEQHLPRIFEPFFTTKEAGQGTGLGLDITYRIVTSRHGGTIDVTSRPGETRFSVKLPALL